MVGKKEPHRDWLSLQLSTFYSHYG